ncbi:S-formylglutathione hydrolase [Periplaneta americana]|uniref:S-formylglutathione hydrolase n=1 Tax=Periplaneta americana TaxID=6978 RepID=UPI0037E7EEAF
MSELKEVSSNRCFGGFQKIFSHDSKELGCKMNFAVYLPPQAEDGKVPVIYWLSGLTCTEQNFIFKSGFQRYASEYGVIVIGPDTSPRGCNIPGEDESYDFGTGAGFYLDATQEPWNKNYRMFSYVTKELPEVVNSNFPVLPDCQSIMGHSMGGHGALICALKNPGKYRTVSVFAAVCNPTQGRWGKKVLAGYLGSSESSNWADWDATELVKKYNGPPLEILLDQGKEDEFLAADLFPENFVNACKESQTPVILHMREGYDHSYYYIATFIGEHFKHHLRYLKA